MNRSFASFALLGIATAIACSDDTSGTGAAGGLAQAEPAGGAAGAAGEGASTAGDTGKGGASPGAIPDSGGCLPLSVVWQNDERAVVLLDCSGDGQPFGGYGAGSHFPGRKLSRSLDGGETWSAPSARLDGGNGAPWLEHLTARIDGSLVAAGGTPLLEGSAQCGLSAGSIDGRDWHLLAGGSAFTDCVGLSSVTTSGESVYFVFPDLTNGTQTHNSYGLVRRGATSDYVNVTSWAQPENARGGQPPPEAPSTRIAPLVEPDGAIWAIGQKSLARSPAGATFGDFGPIVLAPSPAEYVGLNGAHVAWIVNGALYRVAASAPAFGAPIAVPGLLKQGRWQGAYDETGRIVLVEGSESPGAPGRIATVRANAASAADVNAFVDLSPSSVVSSNAPFAIALRKGRVLIAAQVQGGVAVYAASPSF